MNINQLKGIIRANGLRQRDIAEKIGVSLSRFNAKLNNTGGAEFTLEELRALKTVLSLTPTQINEFFYTKSILKGLLYVLISSERLTIKSQA